MGCLVKLRLTHDTFLPFCYDVNCQQLQTLFVKMNGKSRYLPRLNLCYLQKKAYEIHMKKMNTIQQRPKPFSKVYAESPASQEKRFGSITENRMQTIQQKINTSMMKLSPYRKKILEQTERENMRLFQAIQKCPSTINRKTISQHKFLNQQLRERICKFAVLPGSRKTLLKCQISLDKMNKSNRYSRVNTFATDSTQKQTSRERNHIKTQLSQRKKMFHTLQTSINKQLSRDFMINRNKSKINNHFERSELSLRTNQKLQGFRQNMESSKKMHSHQIYKWKTRCFTTQMETHGKQESS